MIAFGSLCLAIGLLLPMIFHPAGASEINLLHFFRGLLLGLAITVNFGVVWKTSRQRRSGGA
jgi:hypothetical protein